MAAGGRRALQRRQVRRVAGLRRDRDRAPVEVGLRERGRGQHAGRLRARGEAEREHRRPPRQRGRELPVVVGARLELGERRARLGRVAQAPARELVERGRVARQVGFREQHVERDEARLVAIEERRGEPRHRVARPGPAADALEARLVDVDDRDLRIGRAARREREARVVGHRLELGDHRDALDADERHERRRGDDREPHRPARRAPRARARGAGRAVAPRQGRPRRISGCGGAAGGRRRAPRAASASIAAAGLAQRRHRLASRHHLGTATYAGSRRRRRERGVAGVARGQRHHAGLRRAPRPRMPPRRRRSGSRPGRGRRRERAPCRPASTQLPAASSTTRPAIVAPGAACAGTSSDIFGDGSRMPLITNRSTGPERSTRACAAAPP